MKKKKINQQILSRAKPASGETATRKSASKRDIPTMEEFISRRDYTGALTLLEFNDSSNNKNDTWIAYCAFHLGDYKKALEIYKSLKQKQDDGTLSTYIACCYFYLGMYPESLKMLQDAPESPLKTRLSLHLAYKLSDKVINSILCAREEKEPQPTRFGFEPFLLVPWLPESLIFKIGTWRCAPEKH